MLRSPPFFRRCATGTFEQAKIACLMRVEASIRAKNQEFSNFIRKWKI
jgi:hypothetical protein